MAMFARKADETEEEKNNDGALSTIPCAEILSARTKLHLSLHIFRVRVVSSVHAGNHFLFSASSYTTVIPPPKNYQIGSVTGNI
jgi:hypothetical protein